MANRIVYRIGIKVSNKCQNFREYEGVSVSACCDVKNVSEVIFRLKTSFNHAEAFQRPFAKPYTYLSLYVCFLVLHHHLTITMTTIIIITDA